MKGQKTEENSQTGFYRVAQITELLCISASTWWLWVKKGRAPQGIKLSPGTTVWKKSDVHGLVEEIIQSSENDRRQSSNSGCPQKMTHEEREKLKGTEQAYEHHQMTLLIAHWMRQPYQVSFSLYASNWAAARTSCPKIAKLFPLTGRSYISDDCSDFNFEAYRRDHGKRPK